MDGIKSIVWANLIATFLLMGLHLYFQYTFFRTQSLADIWDDVDCLICDYDEFER